MTGKNEEHHPILLPSKRLAVDPLDRMAPSEAAEHGFPVRSGVECEVFLTTPDGRRIGYAAGNRTQFIRLPNAERFELRLPDAAANPYLLQAGTVAA